MNTLTKVWARAKYDLMPAEEIIDFLPVAARRARAKCGKRTPETDREGKVLDTMLSLVCWKFKRLRGALTAQELLDIIADYNASRPLEQRIYFVAIDEVVDEQPVQPSAATEDTVVMPTAEIAVVPPPPPVPEGPQPRVNIMFELTKAINGLAHNQADNYEASNLVLHELVNLNENVKTQNGLLMEIVGNHRELMDYYKAREKLTGRTTLSKAERATIKRPVLTWDGRMLDVTRDDVCWGNHWDEITKVPLTSAERWWHDLYTYLQQVKWPPGNRAYNADLSSLVIYGRDTRMEEIQMIFYRLNPQRVVWMKTFSTDEREGIDLGPVHPKYGKLAVIMQKGVTSDATRGLMADLGSKDIRFLKLHGEILRPGAHTDNIAHNLAHFVFPREMEELRDHQARHAGRTKHPAASLNGTH